MGVSLPRLTLPRLKLTLFSCEHVCYPKSRCEPEFKDSIELICAMSSLSSNGDDTWTLVFAAALSDAQYELLATITDAADNSFADSVYVERTFGGDIGEDESYLAIRGVLGIDLIFGFDAEI